MINNILIIAPHPDDEILGCGGIIDRYVNDNKDVYVVVVTNANVGAPELYSKDAVEKTRKQVLNAHKFLGIKKTIFMDFPAPALDYYPSYKISIQLNKLINELEIDTMFIPHRGDIHKDHKVVHESALVAGRPTTSCVRNIYSYETLSETEWAYPNGNDTFIPNIFIRLTEDQVEKKVNAMKYINSQLKECPHPRSVEAIKALAIYRGSTIKSMYAESFISIREIL